MSHTPGLTEILDCMSTWVCSLLDVALWSSQLHAVWSVQKAEPRDACLPRLHRPRPEPSPHVPQPGPHRTRWLPLPLQHAHTGTPPPTVRLPSTIWQPGFRLFMSVDDAWANVTRVLAVLPGGGGAQTTPLTCGA